MSSGRKSAAIVLHYQSRPKHAQNLVRGSHPFHSCTISTISIGLSVVWKPHPSVTHHITPELTLNPVIATSLLSLTKFVKPDWLETVLAHGAASDSSISLEFNFSLPSPSQHRPMLSSFLPSSLKNHRSWEPNEDRVDLLKAYRVIFVGERGREATEEYKELVRRGAATYECCPVQGGRKMLHSVLAKGQGKGKTLVLVADQSAMVAAVGQDEWDDLTLEAAEFVYFLDSYLVRGLLIYK